MQGNRLTQWQYARIARSVKDLHPEIFDQILQLSEPFLSDMTLIPALYQHYLQEHPIDDANRDDVAYHRMFFVAAVVKLYCPSALYINNRLIGNLCRSLTACLGLNHLQSLSEIVATAKTHFQKNKTIREKIEKISEELMVCTN